MVTFLLRLWELEEKPWKPQKNMSMIAPFPNDCPTKNVFQNLLFP